MSRTDELETYCRKLEDKVAQLNAQIAVLDSINKESYETVKYLSKKVSLYEAISKLTVEDQETLFQAFEKLVN